jgi:hypothetical protein
MSARGSRFAAHARAFAGYLGVIVLFNWPLPARLATDLPGPVGGDTGVYVWNLWVFRHEVLRGRFPLFTGEILSMMPAPVDLSLHNYTLFPDLLAFPLLAILGVVTTFNLVYLTLAAVTAWAMFVLARVVIGRDGEAWLAGLLFGLSPFLVARTMGHLSLTVAAPLPLFVVFLMRAEKRNDLRYAAAAGGTVAWAAMCDPYYAVFCLLIAACYLIIRHVRLETSSNDTTSAGYLRAIDMLLVAAAVLVVVILLSGGTEFRLRRVRIQMRSLYTPILILVLGAILRTWVAYRPRWHVRMWLPTRGLLRLVATAGFACVVPLAPVLYAFTYRLRDGDRFHQPLFWRSSPPGADALALFAPNPNHPWFGDTWRTWLATRPNGYVENVATITIVAVVVVALAVWRYRFRPPRLWVLLAAFFGALTLGPFVHVAGVNTYLPGPWALLRYVPVITAVRMPTRFAIVLMMAIAVLFGLAVAHIADRHPARRRLILAAIGLALGFELAPFPRTTYSAPVPAIYQVIRDDPRNVRVLELPFGIRDGERSQGNFTAASQYYQTFHGKRLIGGYLSRVSNRHIARTREIPMVEHLIQLSENGKPPYPLPQPELRRRARRFLRMTRVEYVIVDVARTPPELKQFAIDNFRLGKIGESDGRELYRVPPPEPPP